ncbi:helix-turn-helix transcriptional regulator [Staphylococcus coagulans]|uniref:helix-turn-helix domain-containing protein n=1 Tax=Staphylococcus coagulans TaxID=74706 RepID=UPI001BE6F968|nr:AraC family transcriptional regulator [Staphylococcus coagulans]MBT2831073.1 helix-turn-helix transcriptional regulator [Staphylococcus coagulans]MBT2859525.1 helix-turn-helix transcriptional regulator [Staphylococcus coagulans]MBU3873033.1 helix-turn-helix transcriptional regulator [Staphylococcus coagulans]UNB48633.1 AraC family transcriptional regulator [Staphylococcus coagulans]
MDEESIHKIIQLVEENLLENYSLDDYVQMTGYSEFHLMRIFKKAKGYTFYNYILNRRIAHASHYLLYTDMSIINNVFMLNFHSQEAFFRSFKAVYGLPPGKYRKLMSGISQISEEEVDMTIGDIKGWIISGTAPQMYEVKLDSREYHSDK